MPSRIGIIGCGNIAPIYILNLQKYPGTDVVALADLDRARAEERAKEYGVPRVLGVEELLADQDVDIVLNLTIPNAHAEVAMMALRAGKHVYNEKPLAIERADGVALLALAAERGLRVGCAPDTFLGGSHQTCRELIDARAIGDPVAGQAFMLCHGHESWHPSPEFYYAKGGGPMFDMGPYYLTALVNLLGPVRRVTGSARITFPTRTITSQPKAGTVVSVETPTHVGGVLDFADGAIVQITTSFDVWRHSMPHIEIYGSEGSLSVPDPNGFGGDVRVSRQGGDWQDVEVVRDYRENSRGLGVLDMALAIQEGRPHRASGALAFHVLDVMHALLEASETGRHIEFSSGISRPEPMPTGD
ncbi:MAG: Gfo/Idh/MocA family oxidoreductase [Fimbriimonadaceae bacterium]|nr:Gfo/Idh/MocA family oxidoreductase [Fimbriimonadaceae bacterium]